MLIAQWIGFWSTLGIILVTGVLGAFLWRWQGVGVFGRFRMAMSEQILRQMTGTAEKEESDNASPIDVLLDGAMIFFAGGLLLTPGVLTDIVGFLLLIPLTRGLFKKSIFRWFQSRIKTMHYQNSFSVHGNPFDLPGNQMEMDDEDIIEGEIISRSSESQSDQKDPKRLD